jgi:hypothetical protein
MKKRNIITAVGASVLGAGAAGYLLMNDNQKEKIKHSVKQVLNNQTENEESSFEKAGQPDQIDYRDESDLENAKMVSEGSQFGVQYYNEQKETDYLQ